VTTGGALHLLLAAALAAPPAVVDPSACAADDLRCTGQAYVAAARASKSGTQRAQNLYVAHRAFLGLFDRSQDSRDLCRAHELIRQARKVPENRLGERIADSERETQSRMRSSGVECNRNKQSRTRPPVVAAVGPAAEPSPVLEALEPSRALKQPRALESSRALEPSAAIQLFPVPSADPARTVRAPQGSAPRVAARSQVEHRTFVAPARPLLIGGGVALGVSLVLGGLTVYFPARAAASRRTCVKEMCDSTTADEVELEKYAAYAAGGQEYNKNIQLGVITGVAGGAALITAVVLLTMGSRRRAQGVALGPMTRPGAGGLVLSGRF